MIACYGEALVDLIVSPYSRDKLFASSQACLGGSVFNFCLAAQRQGLQSLYLNALSNDIFGKQFTKVLASEGVALDAQACAAPTSIAVVQLDELGKASYVFHRLGTADTQRSASAIVSAWCADLNALHTGCLMLTPDAWPQTQQVMAHALSQGCVISVDANLRLAVCSEAAYVACVLQACSMAHVVKVSDDDLVAMGYLAAEERHDLQAEMRAAKQLLQGDVQTRLVALTLGERGACLLTREHAVQQAAPEGVHVVDTVGAGDSFAAALLASLSNQKVLHTEALQAGLAASQLSDALKHAVVAAALCVQRTGCDPATWVQTREAIAEQTALAVVD